MPGCHGRIHLIPAGVCLCAIAQGQTPAKRSECPSNRRDRDVACPSAAPALAGRGSAGLAGGAVRVKMAFRPHIILENDF